MKKSKSKPIGFTLRLIVVMLLVSGLIRLGTVGSAIARGTDEALVDINPEHVCGPDESLEGLFALVEQRMHQLDEKEELLKNKQSDLTAAELLIRKNLEQIEAAEARLSQAIETVDGASEDDIGRLTSVYESMKPKVAADLFAQMTPNFAAGFLGRMSPKSAGEIMSGLTPENAYAISVVLAGRNANVPKE
jgi:flagellar motility protein MotE (MotC chaperone)